MSGKLTACVKGFVFETIPRTETSIVNTSTGTWARQGNRCVLISRYLCSLYSFDFSRLDSACSEFQYQHASVFLDDDVRAH